VKKKLTKQISLGIDPLTGRRIRKRVYGDTQAEIRKQETIAQREFAKHGRPDRTTLLEYINRYEAAYISTKTYLTRRNFTTLKNKCEPLYHKRMNEITRLDLQNLLNDVWDIPVTCKRLRQVLRSLWRSAEADGIVQKNVALRLDVPHETKKEKRPLTAEEKEALKKADFTPQERLLVDILYQFGLRPSEAFALDSTSVDTKNKLLIINKSLSHDHATPIIKSTKTGVTRKLPIPDELLPRLKPTGTSTYLFTNQYGQLFTPFNIEKISKSIINKINLAMGGTDELRVTDMTLYNFRHNRATDLYYMSGNLSTKAKARYMGHSEEMFLRTYSHLLDEKEETELLRKAVQ